MTSRSFVYIPLATCYIQSAKNIISSVLENNVLGQRAIGKKIV